MIYEFPQKVMFRHCDPARIVFFPRYFEMMNDCVEQFFADVLQWPFEELHQIHAVPTAQINCRFAAPSHHGDALTLQLRVELVGRTSFTYNMVATCAGQTRFDTTATLVYVDEKGRPTNWPNNIKSKLSKLAEVAL